MLRSIEADKFEREIAAGLVGCKTTWPHPLISSMKASIRCGFLHLPHPEHALSNQRQTKSVPPSWRCPILGLSEGSAGHPRFCKGLCKFLSKPNGCVRGKQCRNCHEVDCPRKPIKPHKRPGQEKRRLGSEIRLRDGVSAASPEASASPSHAVPYPRQCAVDEGHGDIQGMNQVMQ